MAFLSLDFLASAVKSRSFCSRALYDFGGLVGPDPTDWPLKPDETGVRNHRPRIDAVIAVQKRVAAEYGCAFWDAFAAMGGSGSMVRWVANGLAGRDHVHLTRSGYELLADRLTRDLLNGYSVVSR